jgi:hypothetical protein
MTTDYRALCAELVDALDSSNGFLNSDGEWVVPEPIGALVARARALLDTPERVAPTDEQWDALWDKEAEYFALYGEARRFGRAAYSLGRQHSPTPIPIPASERLPGVEDCDKERRCWWHAPETDTKCAVWCLGPGPTCLPPEGFGETHWLPYHALPLPAAPGEGE